MTPSRRILVIDDDFGFRDSVKDFLEGEGYEVATAPDGRQGLSHLRRPPRTDLILLDLSMPVMDGYEFLAILSADSELSASRVVILSAVAEENLPGVLATLRKPVDLDELLASVKKYSA